jgi:hypothetical protein
VSHRVGAKKFVGAHHYNIHRHASRASHYDSKKNFVKHASEDDADESLFVVSLGTQMQGALVETGPPVVDEVC